MGGNGVSRREPLTEDNGSDCRLKLVCMKKELLVITDQHAAVKVPFGCALTVRQVGGVEAFRSCLNSLRSKLYSLSSY
jgi:hypothetical protein